MRSQRMSSKVLRAVEETAGATILVEFSMKDQCAQILILQHSGLDGIVQSNLSESYARCRQLVLR